MPPSEPIYCCATSVEITLQGHEGPEGYLMSASDQIYLVMDAGTPVAAFTAQQALKAYLRRRLDTFCNPPVYRFADGREPAITTLSRGLAD
jgi:hypothetical protein